MRKFTVVLTVDDGGGFDAAVPALPGCRSWGATRKEAFKNALEAIDSYLKSLAREGDPIPREAGARVAQIR